MHRATLARNPLNTPAAPAGSFRIRQARPGDFQALLAFYVANQSAALPIPSVKNDNARSIANIEAIGMKPLSARPGWMKYDEQSWHGKIVDGEWRYYFADNGTVVKALDILAPLGLLGGKMRLERTDRQSGARHRFEFHLELRDLEFAAKDLEDIRSGRAVVELVQPPARIK